MKSNADTCHKLFKKTGLVTDIGNHNLKGKPLGLPYVSKGIYHVFHQYVIRTHERDRLKAFLDQNGIGCGIYYPYTIHLQPCYQGLGYQEGRFKEAERAAREVLALPIYPELTEKQQELVVHTVEQFFKNSS